MRLSVFQKLRALNRALESVLVRGIPPLVQRLEVLTSRADRPWGRPSTKFKAVVPGITKVGGEDGRDLTRLFESVRDDVETIGEWTSYQAEELSRLYEGFAARRGRLRRRLQQLLDSLQAIRVGDAKFLEHDVRFVDAKVVDMDASTVEYDATQGAIYLRRLGTSYRKVKPVAPTVVSQSGELVAHRCGDPLSVLNLDSSDAWIIETKKDGMYQVVVRLTAAQDAEGPGDDYRINRVFIDPVLHCKVGIDLSPDGYNWVSVLSFGELSGPAEFPVAPMLAGYIRISLGGGVAGIKRIILYECDFDGVGLYRGCPLDIPMQGMVDRMSLSIAGDIPDGTSVRPIVEIPIRDADGATLEWTPIEPNAGYYTLVHGDVASQIIDGETAVGFSAGGWLLSPPDPVSHPQGQLYRGVSQVEVSAFLDYRAVAMLDQSLVDADADRFDDAQARSAAFSYNTIGRTSPIELTSTTLLTGFVVGEGGSRVYSSPLAPFSLSGVEGTWLGIALRQYDPSLPLSGIPVLHPGYFYRLRFWVKPSTRGIYKGSAYAWMYGSSAASHCPFTIMVNDRVVFSSKSAHTLDWYGSSASETTVYWPFDNEWNKVEVYLYRPVVSSTSVTFESLGDQLATGISVPSAAPALGESPSGQVILLKPNFFEESWQVVSDPEPMLPASIWDVTLSDDQRGRYWTWVQAPDAQGSYKILLSSNPKSRRTSAGTGINPIKIDGLHTSDAIRYRLTYYTPRSEWMSASADKVRVSLELKGGNGKTPVIRGYRVRFFKPMV